MGSVIYLTGAPATGKSTLCQQLVAEVPDLKLFCYGVELRDLVNRRDAASITETGIRQRSGAVVRPEDVRELDDRLIAWVADERTRNPIVIDSHPVTKEAYGFRVTAFSAEQVRQLAPDAIVCLYTAPEELERRIRANPRGRPLPSLYELALHTQAQIDIAVQYGVLLGKPCYLVDSARPHAELIATIRRLTKLV
jgi:adenylate kinase